MSTYYIEDGLLKFQALKNDKLKIITTYDNKIWGNMNPFFARSEEEKLRIEQNDNKIANLLETPDSFVLTTPPENTICNLNYAVKSQLTKRNKGDEYINKFVLLRTNSVIYQRDNKKASFIVAPSDCPVIVITDKTRSFVIILHMGFPQLTHSLHIDTLILAKEYFDLSQPIDVFITPYICSKHYIISQDKYNDGLRSIGHNLEKYAKKVYSGLYKEYRYSIDLKSLVHSEIKSLLKQPNIIDTNLCTYEEVEKGNLFSHKYVTDNKQKGIEVPEGNYNVVVNI